MNLHILTNYIDSLRVVLAARRRRRRAPRPILNLTITRRRLLALNFLLAASLPGPA